MRIVSQRFETSLRNDHLFLHISPHSPILHYKIKAANLPLRPLRSKKDSIWENVSPMSYLTTTGEVEAETLYTSAWGLSSRLSPKFYITLKHPLKNNFGRAAVPKGSLLVATLNPKADPGMVVLNAKYFEVREQQIPTPSGAVEINSANGTSLVAKFESQNTQSFFQLDYSL